jgi:hypothetical protein
VREARKQEEYHDVEVGEVRFNGNRHCEMYLTSLVVFPPPADWLVPSHVQDIIAVRYDLLSHPSNCPADYSGTSHWISGRLPCLNYAVLSAGSS